MTQSEHIFAKQLTSINLRRRSSVSAVDPQPISPSPFSSTHRRVKPYQFVDSAKVGMRVCQFYRMCRQNLFGTTQGSREHLGWAKAQMLRRDAPAAPVRVVLRRRQLGRCYGTQGPRGGPRSLPTQLSQPWAQQEQARRKPRDFRPAPGIAHTRGESQGPVMQFRGRRSPFWRFVRERTQGIPEMSARRSKRV